MSAVPHKWLALHHGDAPLIVSFPHTGIEIPGPGSRPGFGMARAQGRRLWVDVLYDFAHEMGATTLRTALSRTVIDVNRDPSGASLYPGQATTGLCPIETFDGEPLYSPGTSPMRTEIARRRTAYYDPYHTALALRTQRLRARHPHIVLFDAHSIRSTWRGCSRTLPQFNIGTNNGATCDAHRPPASKDL